MFFSIAFTIGILEIALRVILQTQPGIFDKYYQSNEFLSDNKLWKVWHYPSNFTIQKGDCFYGEYVTNDVGIKGDTIHPSKPKIALLGDSYVEGYGESNKFIVSHYLDSLLGYQYQALNFGTSGGIGTVHELSIYQNFARFYNPEVVILFYLNYNDLNDNVKAISEGFLDENHEFIYPLSKDLSETSAYISSFETPELNTQSEGGLVSFKMAARGFRSLGDFIQMSFNMRIFDFRDNIAEVYLEEESDNITKGYEIVKTTLQRLKEEVEKDSATLVVVQIADPFQVDDGWISTSEKRIKKKLDPTYPNMRIKNICEEVEVNYLDLYPLVKEYILKNEMVYPFLYHSCDRHHSQLGNLFMARFIQEYLEDKKLIKTN